LRRAGHGLIGKLLGQLRRRVPWAHQSERPVSTENTSQQATARGRLLSCQARAPKIGSPALSKSSATPASA
jgi:hypothetical protein